MMCFQSRDGSKPLASQRFDLCCNNLKGPVRYALRRRLDPLDQQFALGGFVGVLNAKKLIRRHAQRLRDPQKGCEIGFPIPTDVMRIAPLTQPTSSRCLCIGNTQCLRSAPQVCTKHIHGTVLFWIVRTCYELIGALCKTILFRMNVR